MLRKFLLHVLPFLLPFVLYAIWLAASRRKAVAGQQGTAMDWRETPWPWLSLAGLGLVILSFVATAVFTGDEAGGTYVPARYIDGKVVPGELR